jgi:hypothetical protein
MADKAYSDASARVKFKQNLVQGIGAATVFGIAAAGAKALLDMVTWSNLFTVTSILPLAGVAALVCVGVGCLYFGSKFYAESVRMDQNYQAQQIALGLKGPEPARDPRIGMPGAKLDATPDATSENNVSWVERSGVTRAQASNSWEEKLANAPAYERAIA